MIKPEYKDLKDDEFVLLTEYVRSELSGKYMINKRGETKCIQNGKINSNSTHNHRCPTRSFRYLNIKETYPIHLLVANTFLIHEDDKNEVDHIDRNPNNYNLSNLRFVNRKENLLNRKSPEINKNLFFYKLDDSNNIIEKYEYNSFSKVTRDNILRFSFSKIKYKGYYWKRVDIELEDFLSKNNLKESELIFKEHPIIKGVLFSKEGIIKKGNIISLGWKDSDGRRKISINKKPYFIHRLVFETFSGILLKDNEVIDHIDTNISNNNFSNLRLCTQKENMNNSNTLKKLSKAVLKYSLDGKTLLEEFNSLKDACKSVGISRENNCIRLACDGKLKSSHGFIWKYKNN